MRRLEIPSV